MEFMKIEGDKLIFCESLSVCRNCNKPMLKWYKDVPHQVLVDAKKNGLVKETYRDMGLCMDCVIDGGFQRQCDVCDKESEFPKQFAFEVTHYPEYPEGDTEFVYICKGCEKDRTTEVLNIIVDADEFEKVL